MRDRGINAGGPPSTFAWNEFEAHLDRKPIRFGSNGERTGRRMKPLPEVTPEQAAAVATQLLAALRRLVSEVAARGLLTDLVIANAWLGAVGTIKRASNVKTEPQQET